MDHSSFKILSEIYPKEISFLPLKDEFQFLISVILSAQTTDKAVLLVGKELFGKYPTREKLSLAKQEDVEEIIHPLGFFRVKAKNIIACSKRLTELKSIPDNMDDLTKLPGVGRKTANCYLGQFLNKPAIIVDTHFLRVTMRLGYSSGKDPETVEKEIAKEFEKSDWYRISMVLNMHGRVCCYAKKPNCEECPVTNYCPSSKKGKN